MLIRFNVKNFLSFSEREDGTSEEFSMIAGKVRNKIAHVHDDGDVKLLKFAAIYGANAAGKSNLVKAMAFMKWIVMRGLPRGYMNKYCKVDPENKKRPSYFELEFMLNEKYYAYGFEVVLSQNKFISEWLYELTHDNEKTIFIRDISNGKFEFGEELDEKDLREKLNVYAEDIQSDDSVLLLSVLNKNKKTLYKKYKKASTFQDVYLWIDEKLDINLPDRPISDYSYMTEQGKVEVDEVHKIISAFGTGITGFQIVDTSAEELLSKLPEDLRKKVVSDIEEKLIEMQKNERSEIFVIVMRAVRVFFALYINRDGTVTGKTIKFSHGKNRILFDLEEESDGTVRILDLLEILLSGEEKVYVIDELDRCLHPSLTYKFVESFLQLAEKRNVQLIVTTHESRLLDFDLLRRDEIWFVDKRATGESDIYSLEEYNTRFDQKIDKAYLEGRYGGVPVFDTVFPILEEV